MQARNASALGEHLNSMIEAGQLEQAYELLAPALAARTPFAMLRRIGRPVGRGSMDNVNAFLELIAADRTEGGWVVIASALEMQLERDLAGALARCRQTISLADVWYAADTLGEGVAGEALVRHFAPALALLRPWREDEDVWVRRALGTAFTRGLA